MSATFWPIKAGGATFCMSTTPEFGSLRSDDDQWDIVSSVGYTALLVAGWRALHALSPQPLVRDEYAKVFIAASRDSYLAGVLANPGASEDETAFPRLYGVQTRFFDDFFASAGDAGIRQAVIVAAGLDSRAYRLEWADGTMVFEVDLPKVLEFKARVLDEHGAAPKARRIEVAADLRTDWSRTLEAAGFDTESASAWSVEGVLPYLTDEAQTRSSRGSAGSVRRAAESLLALWGHAWTAISSPPWRRTTPGSICRATWIFRLSPTNPKPTPQSCLPRMAGPSNRSATRSSCRPATGWPRRTWTSRSTVSCTRNT
jgi:methyltransferase (TIGR00027 family)